jgi:hypothetical protein
MLKLIVSRSAPPTEAGGWIVEVTVPVVGAKEPIQRLFAVGTADKNGAEQLARHVLASLHCLIKARVKLTPRALARLDVAEGGVEEIDND